MQSKQSQAGVEEMKAITAVKQLIDLGVSVEKYAEANWEVDGSVTLTPLISIQVGSRFLSVDRWNKLPPELGSQEERLEESWTDLTMHHWPMRRTVRELIPDIKEALSENWEELHRQHYEK